ncbi:hypothetical protein BDW68DRAFT_177553 [Aspergillus falconensis]
MGPKYFDNAEMLGKSIVLFSNGKNPFNIDRLIEGAREVIALSKEKKTVGGAHGETNTGFQVPGNIDYNSKHQTDTKSLRVETGTELSNSLDADASLSASYAGVSAEGTVKYSYHGALSASKNYAVFSLDHRSFILTLELPHGKLAVDEELISEAKELPDWPKGDDDVHHPSAEDCDEYRDFFNVWGTYVFRSCTFGARYQMKLECHNTSEQTKEDFETHVKAEYDGVANVKGDAGLRTSGKYKTYEKMRKREVHVKGGEMRKATDLAGASNDPKKFSDWRQSITDSTANDAVSYGVRSIGDMVNETGVERKERKRLVFNLNSSLSFFNSFRIIQGVVWAFPERKPTELDIYFTGPPGLEVSYPDNPDTPGGKAHKKSPATHWKIVVPSAKDTLSPIKVRYIRLCVPPLPVKVRVDAPDKTVSSIRLTRGAYMRFDGQLSREIDVPNLFEDDTYPTHLR